MKFGEHVWGESVAADRVWEQVNGLRPSKAGSRKLMVWQAYIDESIDDEVLVLAGYFASAKVWAAFASDWEQLLPLATLGSDGNYRFKMSEMAALPERMARVSAFHRVIEKHELVAFSHTMRLADYERAKNRFMPIRKIDRSLGNFIDSSVVNPYYFAFINFQNTFLNGRNNPVISLGVPSTEKVDFIFDERREKRAILQSWDESVLKSERPEMFGKTPRFESDDDFLPLQAADFIAWWVRRWYKAGYPKIITGFPWEAKKESMWIDTGVSEDDIFTILSGLLEREHPGEYSMLDADTVIKSSRVFVSD